MTSPHPTLLEQIGRRMKGARLERGLTRAELAERLDVHPNTIRNWEEARRSTIAASAQQIAEALEVDERWLVSGDAEAAQAGVEDTTTDIIVALTERLRDVQRDVADLREGQAVLRERVAVLESQARARP